MFKIENKDIGINFPPYIIAEISANHNGSLDRVFNLIEIAKNSGADAVKLQTYKPDTITLNLSNDEFIIKKGLWKNRTLFDLYKEAHLPWEWHKPIFEHAKKINIAIFSSPFDHSAVDLLESLDTPAYKIASCEIIDLPLIKYVAETKKPIIISTGMANLQEIDEAVNECFRVNNNNISLLHCVSEYPTPSELYNLNSIKTLKEKFGLNIGISDHTISNQASLTAISLGASIIEKHFTLDRKGNGPDDSFSLEPDDLEKLCNDALSVWKSLGDGKKEIQSIEKGNIKFRRSLYFIKEMKAGATITKDCIKSIRPGYGLKPKYFEDLIGKIILEDVKFGTPVKGNMIKDFIEK